MTSHPKLRMVPLALVCVVIVAMIAWLIYQQRQDERAVANLHALEQRLAARTKPIHAMPFKGEGLYTCTSKNGWIYTAPTESELRRPCGSQL
ncbi:hypothetical protein ACN9M1_26580 (plasmid) [Ralstonia sp. R-29]|uniref:hypothetical protein n=1 Tax=Ralstonia sp. R-29 TaxID=3404059 RepID=UPI003CF93197